MRVARRMRSRHRGDDRRQEPEDRRQSRRRLWGRRIERVLWVGLQADAVHRIGTNPVGLKPDPQ